MDGVFTGKAFNEIVFVLINALDKIRCHSDIKGSILFACQDIDEILHAKALLKKFVIPE